VTVCLGGKLVLEVEDSERQNNAHIIVKRSPRTATQINHFDRVGGQGTEGYTCNEKCRPTLHLQDKLPVYHHN